MLKTLQGGRYKILAALGGGGFGQIYVAEDTYRPGNPRCVVKHLQPASREVDFLQTARRLFNTEAEILEKLGHHDQIPQLLAYFEENEEFYLVQEFVDGCALSDELSGGVINETQVISLLQDILNVLEFVHSHQVIHRDIKPSNLIRRQQDGKIILIDFGAVKEIRNQIVNDSEPSEITVAIGTKGYMPNEQSAGKPRFNSDIYAVGIVAIQALTGLRPSKLGEDPNTGEILWRDKIQVSDGLADILDKMVWYDFRVRYQSASEVLAALQQLINPQPLYRQRSWKKFIRNGLAIVTASWLLTTGLVLGITELKIVQPLELAAYDRMMRLRFATRLFWNLSYEDKQPDDIDSRLLIIDISENDLKRYQTSLPNSVIDQLLIKLQPYKPSVIGLNIDQLQQKLAVNVKRQDNIIAACKSNVGNYINPPTIPAENIGFDRVMVDDDGIVRRSLLFANTIENKHCTAQYSFETLLARSYLKKKNRPVKFIQTDNFEIGKASIQPIKLDRGYQQIDGGYQIMLDYRYTGKIAEQVSLADVLENRINSNLVKDRIVIIGTTTVNNTYSTPYRRSISALNIHAHVVSQILTAQTAKRPLFNVWSREQQVKWIAAWALAGGVLAWFLRPFWTLLTGKILILLVLILVSFNIFTQSGWVPLVAPTLALVITGWLVAALRVSLNKYLSHIPTTNLSRISNSRVIPSTIPNQPLDSQLFTIAPISFLDSFLEKSGQTMIQGNAENNQITRYCITCNQGQELKLQILEGNVNLSIIDPDGRTIATTLNSMTWEGFLPVTGDYIIEIDAAKKQQSFPKEVSQYRVNLDVK
jgi:CHASE2 domain-containing sensor protein/predicted Ser/Thr protein kinase